MGEYGPASALAERVINKAGALTIDEAIDLYHAYAGRILISGFGAERLALAEARRAAAVFGLEREYGNARNAAVHAWRHALPNIEGPWLMVGRTIANTAGAMVVNGGLDAKAFDLLIGPWRLAVGLLTPVGPGVGSREPALRLR